jgi:CheY-like chemotaxis protein
MNAIVGFSDFLNDPDLQAAERKHLTDIIIQSSKQLLYIITDIVCIATIEAGQEKVSEKEINLNSVCKMIIEQYAPKAHNQNVTLSFKAMLADTEADIITDEIKLQQILSNLVGNALKFTMQGHVEFGYKVKGDQLEFYVEDTGIGVPPEMHSEIFKRFRQVEITASRQFGGSGLGLSISKAYVEILGGKIWLNSEPGKGSIFLFIIPYKKVIKNEISENLHENIINFDYNKSKTILIAEDEDLNFQLLLVLLSRMGLIIIRAANGAEAVEICRSDKAIDLVLMDIKMPVMNGYEATKIIKELRPHLPVIAQTAYSSDEDRAKAFACGCSDFISKPFKRHQLLTKISEQLVNHS